MRNLFKNIPWPVEFAVIVAGAFGLLIINSVYLALNPLHGVPVHSTASLWHMVVQETVITGILGGALWARGWNFTRLGLQSEWTDGLHGLGVAAASYFVCYVAFAALAAFAPGLATSAAKLQVVPTGLSPWLIAALVVVNSVYEEVFVAGYVITVLKEKTSESIAINVSVALRLLYHLYQGVLGVITIIPIGLIFGYWFAKTGKLWPLIVAHAAINLVSLLAR